MLFIFRHYQKSLYAIVGILLFFSFLLTTFMRIGDKTVAVQETSKEIGTLFDGTAFKDLELKSVLALVDSDQAEGEMHPLLRGIVLQFLVQDHIFESVYNLYGSIVEKNLEECHRKISRTKSYQDPHIADLNVEAIYKRLLPKAVEAVEKLKKEDISAKEYFDLAMEYVRLKDTISPSIIRQFYSYMAAAKGIRVEAPHNVSLIQVHRLSDLFSKKFMDLVAFSLINGAKYAQTIGIDMSTEEVKAEIVAKVVKALKQEKDSSLPFHKISIKQIASGFGLSEERFLEAYRNIALFRRFLEIEKTQHLLDPLMAQKISDFATQKAELEVFKMKDSVHLNSLEDLFKFQCYLESTTGAMQDRRNLGLQQDPLSIEEVEKNAPELLKTAYQINVKKLTLSEISLSVPLKKMLKWQLEDENFYAIADEFRQVQDLGAIDDETRRNVLDKLEHSLRADVDLFSRRRMALEDKEMLRQAFDRAAEERKTIEFLLSGKTDAFFGASDSKDVLDRLNQLEEQEIFSFDNEHFYQVTILEKGESKVVLSYEDASKKGQLDVLLDRYLKARYPQVRILYRDQFEKDGNWLPYDVVKSNLEKIVFKDLLQAIELSGGYKGPSLQAPHQFYLDNRFKSHLETFVSKFDAKTMEDLNLKLGVYLNTCDDFSRQFVPVIDTIKIQRSEASRDLRRTLDQAGIKALVGPQLFDKGQQAYISLIGWMDAQHNAISLVELQEIVGDSAKKEALDLFFKKMASVSVESILDEKKEDV
jgi:hypothetical protein